MVILSDNSLELLQGRFYTASTLIYSFTPLQMVRINQVTTCRCYTSDAESMSKIDQYAGTCITKCQVFSVCNIEKLRRAWERGYLAYSYIKLIQSLKKLQLIAMAIFTSIMIRKASPNKNKSALEIGHALYPRLITPYSHDP